MAALCCASGVCGAEVDQSLVSVAADLAWAREQGAAIERFNLAQQPMAFAETPAVKTFLELSGQEGLPLTLVGAADPVPVRHTLQVPSAQVKSALLLAGLNAPGETVVIEREPTSRARARLKPSRPALAAA